MQGEGDLDCQWRVRVHRLEGCVTLESVKFSWLLAIRDDGQIEMNTLAPQAATSPILGALLYPQVIRCAHMCFLIEHLPTEFIRCLITVLYTAVLLSIMRDFINLRGRVKELERQEHIARGRRGPRQRATNPTDRARRRDLRDATHASSAPADRAEYTY